MVVVVRQTRVMTGPCSSALGEECKSGCVARLFAWIALRRRALRDHIVKTHPSSYSASLYELVFHSPRIYAGELL